MSPRTNTSMVLRPVLWLLTLRVPLSAGIALGPQHDLQPAALGRNDLRSKILGGSDLRPQSLGRSALRSKILSKSALQYFLELANASSSKPVLVSPHHSLLGLDSGQQTHVINDFQPSADFMRDGEDAAKASEQEEDELVQAQEQRQGQGAELPWGIGSPKTGDNAPVNQWSSMPMLDVPKYVEYSLEAGGNIQSFSSAQQDVKLVTQVFENITNGFYVDSNAGDGEINSNTLLLELAGWRGLIMEPRPYWYMNLWSKWRKAWLFLGCLSPHENSTKIGFDTDGNIDMLSGHMIHAHPMKSFMAEMGGRKTIDFWNLNSGNYEAEILNETLLGSGSFLEFGVVLVRFDGRRAGRGTEPYVQMRSRDATEELIFEICHNASLTHIGGLDPYWINHVEPRYGFRDEVWVNPRYFETRGIPTPAAIRSAPPPPLADYSPHPAAGTGDFPWDRGYSRVEEIGRVKLYFNKSKSEAALMEPIPKAHRVGATKLVY